MNAKSKPDVELFVPGPQHREPLGRICYEAFREISDRHGFDHDLPDPDTATGVIGLIQMISQISHHVPPGTGAFFCPLRNASLYRAALKSGCRLSKVMTLMTLGPYEEPSPVWMPSIAY